MGWNLGVLHDQHQPLEFSWASSTLNMMVVFSILLHDKEFGALVVCHLLRELRWWEGGKESAQDTTRASGRVYAGSGMRERERVAIREPRWEGGKRIKGGQDVPMLCCVR